MGDALAPGKGEWSKDELATRAAGKHMLAPAGFDYDDADMLIVEMELMLLRKMVERIVADHRARPADRATPVAGSSA